MTEIVGLPGNAFTPALVPGVADGTCRPFWSVMIPTYNRERYLEESVRSVLDQDLGPDRMQLCVVDNATTTHDVHGQLKRLAGDRVQYVRHSQNIGGIRNINACIRHSVGKWVHVLHDDDSTLHGLYRAYERAIGRHPNAAVVTGPALEIDDTGFATGMSAPASKAGPIDDFLLRQSTANIVSTVTVVVPRWVYERVGGYAEGLVFTPDWEMAFRAGTCGPVISVDRPYAATRWHGGSDTSKLLRGMRHLQEAKATVDELCGRLPLDVAARLPARRYEWLAAAANAYASLKLAGPADQADREQHFKWARDLYPPPKPRFPWMPSRMRNTIRALLGR